MAIWTFQCCCNRWVFLWPPWALRLPQPAAGNAFLSLLFLSYIFYYSGWSSCPETTSWNSSSEVGLTMTGPNQEQVWAIAVWYWVLSRAASVLLCHMCFSLARTEKDNFPLWCGLAPKAIVASRSLGSLREREHRRLACQQKGKNLLPVGLWPFSLCENWLNKW